MACRLLRCGGFASLAAGGLASLRWRSDEAALKADANGTEHTGPQSTAASLYDRHVRFSGVHGAFRTARAMGAAARIALLYKLSGTDDTTHARAAEILARVLAANGGLYVKLGQHLAALRFVLPDAYCDALARLHDANAPVSPPEAVRAMVAAELGAAVDAVFSEFDAAPVGCASLAQVHRARLRATGQEVAVKVQHPRVAASAAGDLRALAFAAAAVHALFPSAPRFDWIAAEARASLPVELDFLCEARNAERTRALLESSPSRAAVIVPAVHSALCTPRVLVMDYYGPDACDTQRVAASLKDAAFMGTHGIRPRRVARALAALFGEMVFVHGWLHCDPHPGNVLVAADGRVVLLDHGLYREIPRPVRVAYAALWRAVMSGSEESIREAAHALDRARDAELASPESSASVNGHATAFGHSFWRPDHPSDRAPVDTPPQRINHRLLACVLTRQPWRAVAEGRVASDAPPDATELRKKAAAYAGAVAELLSQLPPSFVLLLKTNDLLRHLARVLKTDGRAGYAVTARHCVDTLYSEDSAAAGPLRRILLLARLYASRLAIILYDAVFSRLQIRVRTQPLLQRSP